jgi:hypothetical protein
MPVEFIQHNIRMADATETRPGSGSTLDKHPWFLAAQRVLDAVFPGDKSRYRIADLGCLEGGYATGFARMGFRSLGLDVCETNIAACELAKGKTGLKNLEFARDDPWNVAKYGPFDAIVCRGLFDHMDRPRPYLQLLSNSTNRLLILQTHFGTAEASTTSYLPAIVRKFLARAGSKAATPNMIQCIRDVGFDCVMEQFDGFGADIRESMLSGYYHQHSRGTYLGLKSAK